MSQFYQNDVIKWKYFPCYLALVRGVHRRPVDSPHKGQWCAPLMLALICAWTNAWTIIRYAGDLRRHCVHYDTTVMMSPYASYIVHTTAFSRFVINVQFTFQLHFQSYWHHARSKISHSKIDMTIHSSFHVVHQRFNDGIGTVPGMELIT